VYTLPRFNPCSPPARANDIDPNSWLTDILTRLPTWPSRRLDELLPVNGYYIPVVSDSASEIDVDSCEEAAGTAKGGEQAA
jgi:transposase